MQGPFEFLERLRDVRDGETLPQAHRPRPHRELSASASAVGREASPNRK